MSVGAFLFAWMKQEAGVTALIGAGDACRCYPAGEVPQNATYPLVTYQVVDTQVFDTLGGPAGVEKPLVQVDAWARTHSGAAALAKAIRGTDDDGALNGYQGTLASVKVRRARLVGGPRHTEEAPGDGSDEAYHRVSQDFEVWHDD